MKASLKSGLALAFAAALVTSPLAALADSEDAFCEVRVHGEPANEASGYCTVSQSPGLVSIRLANGESYELEPGEHTGRLHDQDGRGVDHQVRQDGSHHYGWEDRNITVYFDRSEGIYH